MNKIQEFIKTGTSPDGRVARNCLSIIIDELQDITVNFDTIIEDFFGDTHYEGGQGDDYCEYTSQYFECLVFDSFEELEQEEKTLTLYLQNLIGTAGKVTVSMYIDSKF